MTTQVKRKRYWEPTNGYYNTPEYKAWSHMKSRCYNKKDKKYPIYGGRGIKICKRWKRSFSNFLQDVGKRPTPEHSIDRINTNGNYCPSNVRWSTKKEQANNRNGNHKFRYKNQYLTVMQISELSGIKYTTLLQRLCIFKWSVYKSVNTLPGAAVKNCRLPIEAISGNCIKQEVIHIYFWLKNFILIKAQLHE